jgi:enoyl-CoA hydratase/carnithine racemase
MSDRITVTTEHQVARVCLNRPDKRNALDLAMFRAIAAAQGSLRANRQLRAVVLAGTGVDFCSGLDVKSAMHDRRGMVRLLWKWLPWRANLAQRAGLGWRDLAVPVVAALQGRCWGGGLQIALGADFRIAAPDASLSVMESKWGLIPDMGGTLALRELLGRDQAMKLAMTAEEISGERALELGLVTALSDDPLAAAESFAARLAERPPAAVRGVKRLYRKSWVGSAGMALARESAYQVRILARHSGASSGSG